MNAAVCVVVTVPNETEELRLNPRSCSCCGGSLAAKRISELGVELCERCWRLENIAASDGDLSLASMSFQQPLPARPHHPLPPRSQSRSLEMPYLKTNSTLEHVLRAIVDELRLDDVFWAQDLEGKQLQARFYMRQDENYEKLLYTLQEWGVGERPGTQVSAQLCLETRAKPMPPSYKDDGQPLFQDKDQEQGQGWQNFMDSVRCRLNVNQVVRQVRRDATLTFDFVVLLIAAALLSCVGLVENSFLFLSSSMLISPLMGPIIAAIFGSVIGDKELRYLGLKNELIGIGVSVGIGFLFGGIVCGFGHFFAISTGLTEEIVSRCDTHSLAIGICTALASGAAGAIAVLGGNTGSLVGVAISASLLPPAVNAGLLWALSIGTHLLPPNHELLVSLTKHRTYSTDLSVELLVCATVSMALTLLNIVCVWLMGVVVLRIKEVAPAVQRHHQFWRHDVRTAREVAHLDPDLQDAIDKLDESQLDLEAPHYQHTWSPGMDHPRRMSHSGGTSRSATLAAREQPNNYHTVHGFKEFCVTLHRQKAVKKEPRRPLSIMELFSPQTEPSSGPTTNTTPHTNTTTTTGCSDFSSCRSLPDISSLSMLCPQPSEPSLPRSSSPERQTGHKDRGNRTVHWPEEQPERNSDPPRRHEGMASRGYSPKRKPGQVLIPLPSLEQYSPLEPLADQLLLLRTESGAVSLEIEPEGDEFQV
ncbi:uncharacterized protein [Drosophila bipectinata]|uniref:uncharacterized protein n=1 Tax=Drosophila bipectinata TaxID=42026 RepID=UPI001C897741|nr:uncharacterized protein LOC108121142 [Drosophila bipectinata]